MKLRILLIGGLIGIILNLNAQNYNNLSGQEDGINVITTAVPFLMIGPDARAGGMADGGVASSPDANSMHWNAAKYAFAEEDFGVSLSYTPWLRNLVNDINLAYLSGYVRLDELQTIAFSLRYFTLGEINFTGPNGEDRGTYKPNEFAFDGTYARKLHKNLSLAVAGRFIYSNLTQGQSVQGQETKAGISVAADVSLYWQKKVDWFDNMDAEFAWGMNISNMGNKISYSNSNIQKDFIPTNLRIGPRLTLELDDYNKISFQADFNKLLVPTPPIYALDEHNNRIPIPGTDKFEIAEGKDNDVPPMRGMLQSFYDAPGGAKEELREINYAIGMEYWYNDILALRGGFFWEDKTKGDRKYFDLGVGLRYNTFGLDFSYLIPVVSQQHPLQNTLRFSLLFDFGKVTKSSAPRG
jgi:hypothetical protein